MLVLYQLNYFTSNFESGLKDKWHILIRSVNYLFFCFVSFILALLFFCCCFCCILLSRLLTPFNNLKDKFLAYLCLNRSCRMWTELSFVAWRRAGRFNFYWLQRKSYSFKWMHQTLRHTYWNLHCERPIRIVFTRPGHLASQSGYWFRIDPLMPAYTPSLFCLCPGLFREKLLFAQFHHAYRAPYLAVFLTQTTSDITSPPYQPAPWSLLQIFVTSEGWQFKHYSHCGCINPDRSLTFWALKTDITPNNGHFCGSSIFLLARNIVEPIEDNKAEIIIKKR